MLTPRMGYAESPPSEEKETPPFKLEPIRTENVFECLKACNTSVESAEEFCRSLPADNKKRKALCWSAVYAGKAACQVFCRTEFGPPRP